MKTRLVTLVIGDEFRLRWQALCEPGWRNYAARHGYDLLAVPQSLDASPRARARSPAWQKCLVLGEQVAAGFDRIVWIDADIIINPAAPAITDGVPIDKIGAVDEHAYPTPDGRRRTLTTLVEMWRPHDALIAASFESFLDPPAWHAMAGLPRRGERIVQTGVMVLSPQHHRELLEHVYFNYEDVGGAPLNFEMRPLSFEVQERGIQHWIDGRFNALAGYLKLQHEIDGGAQISTPQQIWQFLWSEYHRNYFLHFAGQHALMRDAHMMGIGRAAGQGLKA
jgi:hypothetical protein